jgi:hypothetical protein
MADAALQTPPAAKPVVVYKPKHPAGLAKALVIALYVDLATDTLNLIGDTLNLRFVSQVDPETPTSFGSSLPGEAAIDIFQGLCGLLQVIVFLVCGFLCLKWIYRVSLNAHSMAPDMKTTPAWGVGWFFVPIANLWKPYQGVRETWQVSAAGGVGWQSQVVPTLLGWWWLAWIVANILGNIAFRLQMSATSAGAVAISSGVSVAQDVANIPLDVLFIFVVRRLTAVQIEALSGRVFD